MTRELKRMKARTASKVENAKKIIHNNTHYAGHVLPQMVDEEERVAQLSHNASTFIADIDQEFREKTKLSNTDITFLFICTALQCTRQYVLTNDKFRISAKQGDILAENTFGIVKPDWNEILFQSVPYDAIRTSTHISETGLAGTTHRYRTLGHDPVLGWIFGTANIMTNSLTKTDFVTTYQVSNMTIIRHYPLGTIGMLDRAVDYSKNDPALLATAVARQAIHFGSDYFTKQGLPVPLVATVDNNFAKTLITKGHIDMWSVTRGIMLSSFINQLIAVIHRLFYDSNRDGSEAMYEVRTRKILSYSNALATGSNVVISACTKNLNRLDIGGIITTLHRFISDTKFINEVKKDFLKNEVYKTIIGTQYDFMGE